jgi:3-carboxy-cis,cis-muconate cycloisomerase
MSMESISSLFSTSAMTQTFSLVCQLQAMTQFEWALSVALEKRGLADQGSAAALETLLDARFVDSAALLEGARQSGNIAIPFVRQLTAAVTARNVAAARTVHLGATSQDVLDTALVLQLREAIDQIRISLAALDLALTAQVRAHAETVMMGRTWLQPAPPITVGLKFAGTLAALRRHKARLDAAAERILVLQFGGAVGTLAVLGDNAESVARELALVLGLREPDIPWHAHRDNLVEAAQVLALITGTLAKFARDISLLMQAEVGEVSEQVIEGRGGSSTIPHKHNPVACAAVIAAATRVPGLIATLLTAMPQEHERGLGLWPAEWETLPEVFRLTAAALDRAIEIAQGLEVHPERMRANFEAVLGLPLTEAVSAALTTKVGREAAHAIVRKAADLAQSRSLQLVDALRATPEITEHLSEAELLRLTDSANYVGSAQRFISRVLGDSDAVR